MRFWISDLFGASGLETDPTTGLFYPDISMAAIPISDF